MANLGTIVERVSSRLKDPSNTAVSRAEIVNVINDSINHWSKTIFWFNDHEETVVLTEGDPVLPALSTDVEYLYKVGGMVINYANARWEVRKVSSADYDEMNVEALGIPFAYTYRNGQYELYNYPDQTYNCVVRGIKDYADLVDDTDTNDFTDNAESLILYEALSRLYAELRQDTKMEAYYAARVNNEKKNLKKRSQELRGSGELQVECF